MDGSTLALHPPDAPDLATGPGLIFDSFAGGGGASTGIERALGRSPDVAINHDEVALAMHEANHPGTKHLITSVYSVDPRDHVAPGQRVGLAWYSPDCKHHSKAKGGKPLNKNIRDLAWVVVHHAELIRPEVILLENVEEFQDWGPLIQKTDEADNPHFDKDGNPHMVPDPDRKGETFREWVRRLRVLGYKVDWRELRACDFGAPTIRKRLFVQARCDGRPIAWPEPTHGDPKSNAVKAGQLLPWRTAADIIDWSLPCPSIFETSEEIMAKFGIRAVRPLKDNTLRRIARGIQRYVIEAAEPFIVTNTTGHAPRVLNDPLATLCTGNHHGLVTPVFAPFTSYAQHGGHSRPADQPLHTITASLKDQNQVIVPTLVQTGYGEAPGQKPRSLDLHKPIGTMVAGGTKHALVAAFLAQHNGGPRMDGHAGRSAAEPLSTLTTRGTQQNVVAAHLQMMRNAGNPFTAADEPMHTITAEGARPYAVAAFMTKYYGQGDGQACDEPCHTLTTRDRFGVVTVEIYGQTYAITDIGMRMLTPREQFRAQGFGDDYIIDRTPDGRPITKTQQTQKCGNSVSPHVAEALVRTACAHMVEA